jgi:hypothetical protein
MRKYKRSEELLHYEEAKFEHFKVIAFCLEENKKLKETIVQIKNYISEMHNVMCHEINEYFFTCNSIRNTTERFFFEDVRDCYDALLSYNGCSDPIQSADDYKLCHKEIFGYEYEDE